MNSEDTRDADNESPESQPRACHTARLIGEAQAAAEAGAGGESA